MCGNGARKRGKKREEKRAQLVFLDGREGPPLSQRNEPRPLFFPKFFIPPQVWDLITRLTTGPTGSYAGRLEAQVVPAP